MTRRLALLAAAAVAAVSAVPAAATSESGEAYLEQARDRAASTDWSGVAWVEWSDAGGHPRVARLRVRSDDGELSVQASRTIVSGHERAVLDRGDWLVRSDSDPASIPRASDKYDLSVVEGAARVAGRDVDLVAAVDAATGRTVERQYVDPRTGVVLRRELLDDDGRVDRAMWFAEMWDDSGRAGLDPVAPPTAAADEVVAVDDVGEPFHDPDEVGRGFELVGRYRHGDDLVQLFYSDGLLDVSVFEQPGELDWDALPPGGGDLTVDGDRVRVYPLALGRALVWDADGVVYTCIGDAPLADLGAVLADVDDPPSTSLLARVAHTLLAPFTF